MRRAAYDWETDTHYAYPALPPMKLTRGEKLYFALSMLALAICAAEVWFG